MIFAQVWDTEEDAFTSMFGTGEGWILRDSCCFSLRERDDRPLRTAIRVNVGLIALLITSAHDADCLQRVVWMDVRCVRQERNAFAHACHPVKD